MPLPNGGVPKRSGPFTIKGTDRKFKVDWTTAEHTGTMVPVTAPGRWPNASPASTPTPTCYDVVMELFGGENGT